MKKQTLKYMVQVQNKDSFNWERGLTFDVLYKARNYFKQKIVSGVLDVCSSVRLISFVEMADSTIVPYEIIEYREN